MNIERYRMVMHRIWADLRTWDQRHFHKDENERPQFSWQPLGRIRFESARPSHQCGTAHCVAGWAQIISMKRGCAADAAQVWLDLTDREADWLFESERTLADLNAVLKRGRVFE